jgi:hypothetical protein
MNSHELVVIGRSLIAVMFIASAVGKAANWKTTIGIMQIHGLPYPSLALSAALILSWPEQAAYSPADSWLRRLLGCSCSWLSRH